MNVKNLVLGIGIFIVFMFVLHNGIRAFYPAPEYNNFCSNTLYETYPQKILAYSANCTFSETISAQEQQCYSNSGQPVYNYSAQGCVIGIKKCNYCQRDFDEATKSYDKVVFIIALIIGIAVLILGYSILSAEPVGSALMASGIGAIIYGTIINWVNLGNLGRFLLLLLSLIVLIWIALRINKKGKALRWIILKKLKKFMTLSQIILMRNLAITQMKS